MITKEDIEDLIILEFNDPPLFVNIDSRPNRYKVTILKTDGFRKQMYFEEREMLEYQSRLEYVFNRLVDDEGYSFRFIQGVGNEKLLPFFIIEVTSNFFSDLDIQYIFQSTPYKIKRQFPRNDTEKESVTLKFRETLIGPDTIKRLEIYKVGYDFTYQFKNIRRVTPTSTITIFEE